MKRKMFLLVLSLTLVLAWGSFAQAACGPNADLITQTDFVNEQLVISTSGEYCLVEDIIVNPRVTSANVTLPPTTSIVVTVPVQGDVELNFNGHKLRYQDPLNFAPGVKPNAIEATGDKASSRITIHGGSIKNFNLGAHVNSLYELIVEDITFDQVTEGINSNTQEASVQDNIVDGVGSGKGFNIIAEQNAEVHNNIISDTNHGMIVKSVSGNYGNNKVTCAVVQAYSVFGLTDVGGNVEYC